MLRRDGQDDFWLNIGLAFAHKDDGGFNIMLQALPLDGKIVCRAITADEQAEEQTPSSRSRNGRTVNAAHRARLHPLPELSRNTNFFPHCDPKAIEHVNSI